MDRLEFWGVIIIFFAMLIAIGLLDCYRKEWKRKYQDLLNKSLGQLEAKDKKIRSLETQFAIRDSHRTIKVEKFVTQPYQFECKFQTTSDLIEHSDLFKRLCISEASRYLAEELGKEPTLYRLLFEMNPMLGCENVRMQFRLLPYPEGVTFEEYFESKLKELGSDEVIFPSTESSRET